MFTIQENIALAPLTTFRIGGPAEYLLTCSCVEDVIAASEWAQDHKLPLTLLAGGSNVVVADQGIRGAILRISGGEMTRNDGRILLDAGVLLSDLVGLATKVGFSGAEYLVGIPGTVGGAIVGNAGAYGRSLGEFVEKVEIWNGKNRVWLRGKECEFSYRTSVFKKTDALMLRAVLAFSPGEKKEIIARASHILKMREEKYKPGLCCPGSFFQNVLVTTISSSALHRIDQARIIDGKIPAGYLLDKVGARGMRVGGIEIASFHGNLFVNIGKGTANDVKTLANLLKTKVQETFGITLVEEVRYL